MDWILETVKCVYTWTRKGGVSLEEDIQKPIPLNDENFKLIEECSWLGCGLEFYEKRPIFKKARINNRYYAFCCNECYTTWLKSNYFFY
jgi:hypothetical protein